VKSLLIGATLFAVGVALAGGYLDGLPYHGWTPWGDSELAGGPGGEGGGKE